MPKVKTVIHISFDIVDKFIPRIPTSRMKGENKTIKRICACPTLYQSLIAMPCAWQVIREMERLGLPVIIHAYYLDTWKITDARGYVPDAAVTGEVWLRQPPIKVRRFDYLVKVPDIENNTLLRGVRFTRTRYQDNISNLCRLYGADEEAFREYMDEINIGYAGLITNLSGKLEPLSNKGIYITGNAH